MNFPAIAKLTYDNLKEHPAFSFIADFVKNNLRKMSPGAGRARFVHDMIDDYNMEVFAHPLVKELIACKPGCSACCHTQVSITEDEADLLAMKIQEGVKIDYILLQKQMIAKNDIVHFNKLSFNERKCVFLGSDNLCKVYEDRPSVCRTNAVLGEASQCLPAKDGSDKQTLRLVKTSKSDMVIIGSFMVCKSSGTLAYILGEKLLKKKTFKKFVSNDSVL